MCLPCISMTDQWTSARRIMSPGKPASKREMALKTETRRSRKTTKTRLSQCPNPNLLQSRPRRNVVSPISMPNLLQVFDRTRWDPRYLRSELQSPLTRAHPLARLLRTASTIWTGTRTLRHIRNLTPHEHRSLDRTCAPAPQVQAHAMHMVLALAVDTASQAHITRTRGAMPTPSRHQTHTVPIIILKATQPTCSITPWADSVDRRLRPHIHIHTHMCIMM